MNYEESKKYLQEFCNKHDIDLVEKGECGICRPCVGILKKHGFIDYNPCWYDENYESHYYFEENELFFKTKTENAYHKHDCFAILCSDDDESYNEALIELADWIKAIESKAKITIKTYETKSLNANVFFTGDKTHYAMVLEEL